MWQVPNRMYWYMVDRAGPERSVWLCSERMRQNLRKGHKCASVARTGGDGRAAEGCQIGELPQDRCCAELEWSQRVDGTGTESENESENGTGTESESKSGNGYVC